MLIHQLFGAGKSLGEKVCHVQELNNRDLVMVRPTEHQKEVSFRIKIYKPFQVIWHFLRHWTSTKSCFRAIIPIPFYVGDQTCTVAHIDVKVCGVLWPGHYNLFFYFHAKSGFLISQKLCFVALSKKKVGHAPLANDWLTYLTRRHLVVLLPFCEWNSSATTNFNGTKYI